jgi:4-oxalocrotonate tautomerase
MPYVRIEITDGATYEQKLQIYKETTEMLQRILNKKPEYTFVVLDEVPTDNWGHHGTSVTKLRAARAKAAPAKSRTNPQRAPAKNSAARKS